MPSKPPTPPTPTTPAKPQAPAPAGTPAVVQGTWRDEPYRRMVEGIRDYAVFLLDTEGHVVTWNLGAERIKGYKPGEIIGRHFSAFYPPEDIAAGKPPRELKHATRHGKFEEEGIRLRKDGSAFWASVVITAVRDKDGSLVGFAKVTRDLTERRAAQERAIADTRRLAKAEAANTAKGEFLAAMSHELRTPLNAIGGYTELLSLGLGGPVNSEQLDYLERIRKSQQHLLGIISDLLNFSRIEAGHINYALVPIHLQKVIDSVMPMVEPGAAAKALKLRIEPSSGDCLAVGDTARVDQILLNLLSNAIKYTSPSGSITVKCGVSGDTVSISVTDTGRGVPKEKLEAIFEPFVQLGRSLSSAHEGMGLGLSISRDLARAMNGDLTVVSKVGEGSTFTLVLPRSF